MKILSKTLAIILCLAMLLSYIPGVAFTAKATEVAIEQPAGVSIVENYDEYIGTDWVAQLGMPKKVTVGDGEADVLWEDATKYVDLKNPGYYAVPGTVNGVEQAVYFLVQVRKTENLFANIGIDFEQDVTTTWNQFNGTTEWVTDKANVLDGERAIKQSTSYNQQFTGFNTYVSTRILQQYEATGYGDYYFGIWMKTDCDKFNVKLDYYPNANNTATGIIGKYQPVGQEYTQISLITEVTNAHTVPQFKLGYNDLNLNASAHPIYMDKMELIALKLPLTEAPAVVTKVTTELPAVGIVEKYDTYVGEDWKAALGLPAELNVEFANGTTGTAAVEWDYTPLGDLTQVGRYVLNGKLTGAIVFNADIEQVIFIQKYKNLLTDLDADFEQETPNNAWIIRSVSGYTNCTVTDPVKAGKYAVRQKSEWNSGFVGLTSNVSNGMVAAVDAEGAGQYYFGVWMQTGLDSDTGLKNNNLNVTPKLTNAGSTTWAAGTAVKISCEEYTQVGLIANLTGDESVLQLALGYNSTDAKNAFVYLDHAEMVQIKQVLVDVAEPAINEASLALQNNLAIKFTAEQSKFGTDYTDPYVVFSMNGKETTVEGTLANDGKYAFWFKNIAPHQIADTITATLHASYYGADIAFESVEYSVLTYCKNKFNDASSSKSLKTLLADLINYSVALQVALNKTPMDTDGMVDNATTTTPTLESKLNLAVATVEEPTVKWDGAALVLKDAVTIRLYFQTQENVSDLKVKISTTSNSWEITDIKADTTENIYYIDFNGLNAAQMREVINATVFNGDTAISNTIAYSVETYAAGKQNVAAENLGNLVKAMMKYGDSASAFES